MLIAFEGIDGSGKTTGARLLRRWLSRQRHTVFTQWNSSKIVSSAIKKGKRKRALGPHAYSLIHAADFAERYENIIVPALAEDHHVICDRYIWTGIARDVARGCNREPVEAMYDFACAPDITFYVRLDPAIACSRKKGKPKYYEAARDIFPRCDASEAFCLYQAHVAKAYESYADRFVVIDGTLSPKKQQKLIRAEVVRRMTQGQKLKVA